VATIRSISFPPRASPGKSEISSITDGCPTPKVKGVSSVVDDDDANKEERGVVGVPRVAKIVDEGNSINRKECPTTNVVLEVDNSYNESTKL